MEDVAALKAELELQRTAIEELTVRLREVESERGDPPQAEPRPSSSVVTDRRGLLRHAGAAAAGAVAGVVVLGQASPAAAAISETGNPAVLGTASPVTGTGVRGISDAGKGVSGITNGTTAGNAGVEGQAPGASGTIYGVRGVSGSPDGIGVAGANNSGSGNATGVWGNTSSPDGRGVWGRHLSAVGAGKGVFGETTSSSGIGVHGLASSVTGSAIGVMAQANGALSRGVVATSLGGTAIEAESNQTQLRFLGVPVPPPSTSGNRQLRELVCDQNGDLWLCVAAGDPGTWRTALVADAEARLRLAPGHDTGHRTEDATRRRHASHRRSQGQCVRGPSRCDLGARQSGRNRDDERRRWVHDDLSARHCLARNIEPQLVRAGADGRCHDRHGRGRPCPLRALRRKRH
jgi:hypothetical protein